MTILTTFYRWQYHGRQWYAGHAQRRRGFVGNSLVTGVSPRRVLIVLTGLLGDAVMSTPVIVEARRLWPDARIVMLGNRQTCALLSECPLIDDRFEAPAVPFSLRNRQSVGELQCWMKEQEFDIAIILLGDQFAQLLANAQIPERVGVRGHLLAPFLTKTYDIRSPKDWGPPERLGALALWATTFGTSTRNSGCQVTLERQREQNWSNWALPSVILTPPCTRSDEPWRSAGRRAARGTWLTPCSASTSCGRSSSGGQKLAARLGPPIATSSTRPASLDPGAHGGHRRSARGYLDGQRTVPHCWRPQSSCCRNVPARRPEHARRYHQADVVFGCDDACDTECRWDHCRKQPCRQMKALLSHDVVAAVRQTLMYTESQVMNAVLKPII